MMATIGATPALGGLAASPFTPDALRPGPKPGVAFRPLQTPMHGTPTARGVSGFYVPVTPKKAKDTAEVGMGLSDGALGQGEGELRHLDGKLPALERIKASRLASDETSPEVRRLKAELWSACLAIVERDDENATADELAAKTDKMVAEHWLLLRKDRIARAFDPASRTDETRESGRGSASQKEWQRKISQSAPSRIQNKLTHGNYMDWVSEIISILAPIQGATEILEGIEHGRGYLEDQPDVETDNYDLRLDLEIGGLVAGSVSAECRGYVVARQSAGEYRGSVLWRDLVSVMRRGDSVDKVLIFEEVIGERQEPNEGVRSYAERLRSNFIKLGAINAPLSSVDQVMYLLRGLHPRMDTQ
ncbi:unnamed protein product [Tilletia controversa]|uniref:Uncharacterized protein n=1 Tax=Tilletia controversa TaxID=13291 RepID=A0A8X7MIR0_9BASI|nr:hypothetical protein CF335_g9283 [Tilletia laevis]KAE8236158.1 hypothetical protein A4X06_0g9637 [Tilletia controversa]CAD6913788.1 unnamed protein product [Tilletia controversa]